MPLTAEETTRFTTAGGTKLHYHEAGQGPVLICVPATAMGASAWGQNRYNIDALSEHFQVLLLNLPPQGESDKSITYHGPRNAFYAGILRDFMDALGIDRAHLYGGSPGAAVCLRFAMDTPERVDKMVLDAPTGVGPSLFVPMPTEGAKRGQTVGQEPTLENFAELMKVYVPRDELRTEEFIRRRFAAAQDPEYQEARGRITGPMENLTPELHQVLAECLVIWGAADRDIPMDLGLKLVWLLPNAQLHVFGGGTGHWPHYEHANEWNRLVIDFLLH